MYQSIDIDSPEDHEPLCRESLALAATTASAQQSRLTTVVDASAELRLGRLSALEDGTVQLNATNLFDKSYIATLGTGGFSLTDEPQTLQAGARRLVFFTVGTSF